ncbi:MAG: phospholipase D-like domain-containing protein [Thermofilum sp.]
MPRRRSEQSLQAVAYAMIFLAVAAFAAGYFLGRGSAAPSPSAAVQGVSVELLNDRDYYPTLLDLISRANRSIYIMMYVFKSDTDTIMRITNLLVSKAKQGLDVRVILENSIEDNSYAYQLLKEGGVRVVYDSRSVTTHSKLVIIDGYIILVGSHNFSYMAMMRNHESSVLIISPELAARQTEYFMSVWTESTG